MKKIVFLIILNLFLFAHVIAQVGTLKDVDNYLTNYLDRIPVPGFSIVIVEGEDVIFSKGYGIEKEGHAKLMTAQSTLAIGSIGRGFTAMAIMQLVEKGLVDLDEPIISYLPWFQTANKEFSDQITLRMCLSNTTGIPPQFGSIPDLENTSSAEAFLRSLNSVFIKRKPGMSHEFCDEGYAIAGQIIQEISAMTYAEYIQTKILNPLDMANSTTDQQKSEDMKIVLGHEMGLDRCHPAINSETDANFVAAGSEFYANATDLGNYMIALLNDGKYKKRQIVSNTSVDEIFKPNTSFQGLGTTLGGNGIDIQYALGWMDMTIEERNILIHTGNNGNVASIMGINREKDQAFAILFNADVNRLDRFEYPGMEHAVNNVIHILNAEDTTDFGLLRGGNNLEEDYRLPPDKWHKYIGKYESFGRPNPFFKDMTIDVFVGDKGEIELIARREKEFKGQYRLEFTNESRAILRNISFARQIQFSINPEGEVSGLFMFGSEFKKENEAMAQRFQTITNPSGQSSFLLPKSAETKWSGDELVATFLDLPQLTLRLSIKELKAIDFDDYVNGNLNGQTISHTGNLNKDILKKGIWLEQTIMTQESDSTMQNHFASYQDPVSNKQIQFVLTCPWGTPTSIFQYVISAIHRSVTFE